MKEYADLSHFTFYELLVLRKETIEAGHPEDKDFIEWINKEIGRRNKGQTTDTPNA